MKLTAVYEYRHYRIHIKINTDLGVLCGYVRVGSSLPDDYQNLNVHGGITFAGKFSDGGDYWLGFDCAHAGDFIPNLPVLRPVFEHETLKDEAFVLREAKLLIDQLVELENAEERKYEEYYGDSL